jgi:hypothetical protein
MERPLRAPPLPAKVVAYATAFLDGRSDADTLYITARSMMTELMVVGEDTRAKGILDAARLLTIAMLNASSTKDKARIERWREVMKALGELVRLECKNLRESGAIGP